LRLFSKEHKEIVGSVEDVPFEVQFDKNGFAEVEDEAVGNYLLQLQAAVLVQTLPSKESDPKTLEEMHPTQLKKFAKDNGIEIGEASKKDELLPIINAFIEQKYKEQGQIENGGKGDQM
jgi:hypothetical protein